MSYWGCSGYLSNERFTYDLLVDLAKHARQFKSPEEFAFIVCDTLNREFSKIKFTRLLDKGLGIHYTAYEYIKNYWIPELFLISNWESVEYRAVSLNGWAVSRNTCYAVPDRDINERIDSPEFRLKFHSFLQAGRIAFYNNGDPNMFNPIANIILSEVDMLSIRGISKGNYDRDSLIALAQMPIEVVSAIQRNFCREGSIVVGGKPHNLVVSSSGEYYSTTGDDH